MSPLRNLTTTVACTLLIGCSAQGSSLNLAPVAGSAVKAAPTKNGGGDILYVSNSGLYGLSSISLYGGPERKLAGTVTDGIKFPIGIVLSHSGFLYVANYDASTVTVYKNRGRTLVRTISRLLKHPVQLALDSKGNLYVRDKSGVLIYQNAKERVVRRIPGHLVYTFALDAADNVYIATRKTNVISVYAPGSLTPTRTISDGVEVASSLAFDGSGNLYVANGLGGGSCDVEGKAYAGSITIYAPGASSPFQTITGSDGLCYPARLAFSHAGNLYVTNETNNSTEGSVLEYAPASNTLLLTIVQGVNSPTALAFDSVDNLYVINDHLRNVTEYGPNGTSVLRTITDGINSPEDLAVGK